MHFLVIFSSSIYILKNRSFNSLCLCLTVFNQFCLKLGLTQGGVSDRRVKKGKGRARSKMLSRLVMTAGGWLLYPGGLPGKLHECLIVVLPGEERGKNVPTSSGLSPSPVDQRLDSWVLTPLHFQVYIHEEWAGSHGGSCLGLHRQARGYEVRTWGIGLKPGCTCRKLARSWTDLSPQLSLNNRQGRPGWSEAAHRGFQCKSSIYESLHGHMTQIY